MTAELYIEWEGGRHEDNGPVDDNSDMMVRVQRLYSINRGAKIFMKNRVLDILKLQSVRDWHVMRVEGARYFFHNSPIEIIP
jgi:hypothetical protein